MLRFRYAMKGQPKGAVAKAIWQGEGTACIRYPVGAPEDWTRHLLLIAEEDLPNLFVQSRKWELDEYDNIHRRID